MTYHWFGNDLRSFPIYAVLLLGDRDPIMNMNKLIYISSWLVQSCGSPSPLVRKITIYSPSDFKLLQPGIRPTDAFLHATFNILNNLALVSKLNILTSPDHVCEQRFLHLFCLLHENGCVYKAHLRLILLHYTDYVRVASQTAILQLTYSRTIGKLKDCMHLCTVSGYD